MLTEKITDIHERSRGTYGAPRIHAELQAEGARMGLGARRSPDESGGPAWREPPPRRHDHHSKQADNPGQ